jgi:hypothetical protein
MADSMKAAVLLFAMLAVGTASAQSHSPYTGQQDRAIKERAWARSFPFAIAAISPTLVYNATQQYISRHPVSVLSAYKDISS